MHKAPYFYVRERMVRMKEKKKGIKARIKDWWNDLDGGSQLAIAIGSVAIASTAFGAGVQALDDRTKIKTASRISAYLGYANGKADAFKEIAMSKSFCNSQDIKTIKN